MLEIEVKILEINKEQIEETLRQLGARKVFDGEVYAVYYDFANNALAGKNSTLRLRKKESIIESNIELTLKTEVSKKKAKIMQEYEVSVDSLDKMQQILEGIGLQPVQCLEKSRTSYVLNNVHFDIDTLPGIPTFLEIEAPNMKTLEQYVRTIGYTLQDAKPWTGKDVLEYYQKKLSD